MNKYFLIMYYLFTLLLSFLFFSKINFHYVKPLFYANIILFLCVEIIRSAKFKKRPKMIEIATTVTSTIIYEEQICNVQL